MKRLVLATMLLFTTAAIAPIVPTAAAAAAPASALTIPVAGTGTGGTFAGTFQLQKFATDQGQLVASGLLTGVVTTASGATTSIVRTITLPAAVGDATCAI